MEERKTKEMIQSLFRQAMAKMEQERVGTTLTDLFVQVDKETGELMLFDDGEKLILSELVYEWVRPEMAEEAFARHTAKELRGVMADLSEIGFFERLFIVKPFSVAYVNDDFSVIEELLFVDDDTLVLDDDLLQKMDTELNDFLEQLLKE